MVVDRVPCATASPLGDIAEGGQARHLDVGLLGCSLKLMRIDGCKQELSGRRNLLWVGYDGVFQNPSIAP